MIDKAGAIPNILTRLKKTAIGSGIDLRTYKRDRSVVIMRTATDSFSVRENGFRQETFDVDTKGLKKLLKTLLKREFPRSNKIRVYDVTE
ncbi:hypothetical protein [uncultured Pseudodesulfovibrio sp.]|uniref:hypothetical protein n=1 Tax=uncultured Pseudodesulfovibrio sp. TaxID=2035858 RepID=UPI0029C6866E|nr:hypothetical protein [uncultured Pseudodesulfovibrio sp.]